MPKPVRLWWGALKNLLTGVTTVCHHNPHEGEVFGSDFPVRVVRRFSWAHSPEVRAGPGRAFPPGAGEVPTAALRVQARDAEGYRGRVTAVFFHG